MYDLIVIILAKYPNSRLIHDSLSNFNSKEMRGASMLLQLPQFLLGMSLMFWSIALAGISYRLPFLSRRGRNDMYDW